jgi:hypothetical protein
MKDASGLSPRGDQAYPGDQWRDGRQTLKEYVNAIAHDSSVVHEISARGK